MSQRWGWLGLCCLLAAGGCAESKKPGPSQPAELIPVTQATEAGGCCCLFGNLTETALPDEPTSPALAGDAPDPGGTPRNFDWPQWRGAGRTGVSREKGLLQDWPEDGPPLAWKAQGLGQGYTTPSVADGRVFSMGNRDNREYVMAFDEKDGTELWGTAIGRVRANGGGYPGPRCTPTVDGGLVYALGLAGDLVCLEADTGAIRWQKDLPRDFGGSVGGWGYSESPLIDGDNLVCTPGGGKATLACLDKQTGKTLWTSRVPQGDSAAYSSAIIVPMGKQKQYVQFLSGGVVGVDAATGKFLWRYDRPANGTANCTTPIYSDGHVFAASGYGTGGGLVRLVRAGGGFQAKEIYFTRSMKNRHDGMVLVNGYLYGSSEGPLVCLDFQKGRVMWEERRPGKGSIAYADGRLYYRNEGGTLFLVEANPKKFVLHGQFNPPDRSGSPSWPHPVIANGKLYVRDQDVLLCYEVKRGTQH